MNYIERINYRDNSLTWEIRSGGDVMKVTIRRCLWREGKPYSLALQGSCASIPLDMIVPMLNRHTELCNSNWIEPKEVDKQD